MSGRVGAPSEKVGTVPGRRQPRLTARFMGELEKKKPPPREGGGHFRLGKVFRRLISLSSVPFASVGPDSEHSGWRELRGWSVKRGRFED